MAFEHQPVLVAETVQLLSPNTHGCYVDATVGGGGHARALLEASAPGGQLLGVDADPDAVAVARERLAPYGRRVRVERGRYGRLGEILSACAFGTANNGGRQVDGLLVDAGVSSQQLDRPERGFSLRSEGPLDMRMSQDGPTCGDLIDRLAVGPLARILGRYGEVGRCGALAAAMKRRRTEGRLQNTLELAQLVAEHTRSRPGAQAKAAAPIFQALRIAVNGELDDLESLCAALPGLLAEGAVAVFISYHSLEDRIVKRALRTYAETLVPARVPLPESQRRSGPLEILTARPVRPTDHEVSRNPRARSARLRAARRRPIEAAS